MRTRTKEERKRFDVANDAYTKAWEIDGAKVRERLREATDSLHANPRDETAVQEFLDATEEIQANTRLVSELNDARNLILKEINLAVELDNYTTGRMTWNEKVTFINGMKKFIPHVEVDALRRKGLLKEDTVDENAIS